MIYDSSSSVLSNFEVEPEEPENNGPVQLFESEDQNPSNLPVYMEDIADVLSNPPQVKYLVQDALEDGTTGGLIGASGSYKSFVMCDLACSVATGTRWMDKEINRPGVVVGFIGEGRLGFIRRVQAWAKHKGVVIPSGRFFVPRCRVSFDEAGARLIIAELKKLSDPPVLIFIDTMARFLPPGADENSAKEAMAFLNIIDSVRDEFGCVVVLVHHTGHSQDAQNRGRGSSALPAGLDWIMVTNFSKKRLSWTKMKDAECPSPVEYELVKVGDSAVITYTEASRGSAEDYLTKGEKLGLDTLKMACLHSPDDSVHLDKWRDEFYRKHTGDNQNSKRSAFNRARNGLTEKRFVSVDNDIYKLTVANDAKRFNATDAPGNERGERCTTRKGAPTATHPSSSADEVDYYEGELFHG